MENAVMMPLLTLIPDTLRRELDSVAAARREPVSETAAAAILAGLKQIPTNPVSAYHCLRCGSRMTVEREREPLCSGCESAAAQMAQDGPKRAAAVGLLI